MSVPHETWGNVYDLVHERQFGAFYHDLTGATLEAVREHLPLGGAVLDVGGGTGRLAIPLAEAGYGVTVVEPSGAMLTQLQSKKSASRITCRRSAIADFRPDRKYDLALCVFTVVSYLLDVDALERSFRVVHDCLKPDGRLLLDVPSRELFRNRRHLTDKLQRDVSITPVSGSLFRYREDIDVAEGGSRRRYEDEFLIRFWESSEVLERASRVGLAFDSELSGFAATGSRYYWLVRRRSISRESKTTSDKK